MIDQFSFANPRADDRLAIRRSASFDCSDRERGKDDDEDDSSAPSPLLWKNMNIPTTSQSRAQEIAGYRQEMMDLVRGMPESAYELSLRDMVEIPKLVNKAEKATTDNSKGARRLRRNETWETGLFLKTFVPVLDGRKKTKSSRSAAAFAKVSPKPEAEKGLHGSIEGRRRKTHEWRDRGSSGQSSSETSSRSSCRKMKGCCVFLATNKSKSKETSKEFHY